MKNIVTAFVMVFILLPSAAFSQKSLDVEEYASIDHLSDEISRAIPVPQGEKKTPVKIAVLPVRVDRAEILTGLVQRLAGSGKFSVLDVEAVRGFLAGTPETGPAGLPELISHHKLDAVIAIRTYPSEGKQFISVRIFTSGIGPASSTLVGLLDYQPTAASREVAAPAAVTAGAQSVIIPALPMAARYVRFADLDGDGAAEYVFSDGAGLSVYRLDASGWKSVWKESGEKSDQGTDIALDLADGNGNGKPEIYVTKLRKNRPVSVVYEADGSGFKKIADMPGFLRAVRHPKQGMVLLGQDFDINAFFSGPVRRMTWENGSLVRGEEFPLSKEAALYDFVVADMGERYPLLIAQAEKRHLRVYSGETLIWESEDRYGGAGTMAVKGSSDAYQVQRAVVIAGRMASTDLDGDGREEIVVPRDKVSLMGGVKGSELQVLGWTGARLDARWAIKDIPGSVLDLQVVEAEKNEFEALVLIQEKGGLFSAPRPRLVRYRID